MIQNSGSTTDPSDAHILLDSLHKQSTKVKDLRNGIKDLTVILLGYSSTDGPLPDEVPDKKLEQIGLFHKVHEIIRETERTLNEAHKLLERLLLRCGHNRS